MRGRPRGLGTGGEVAPFGTNTPTSTPRAFARARAYRTNDLKVLDYGAPTMPIIEPDTTEPERCDDCEYLYRMSRDFEANPTMARLVYGPDLGLIGE